MKLKARNEKLEAKIAKANTSGFIRGIGYCAAFLVRYDDQPTLASELIKESGFKMKDFEAAETDDYDLKVIKKLKALEDLGSGGGGSFQGVYHVKPAAGAGHKHDAEFTEGK